jgi:hypothetical protein
MQHPPGIDPIERRIRKLQALGITHGQAGRQPKGRQAAMRVLHRPPGQVDAPQVGAGLGKALMIRPQPDADLQHPQTTRLGKSGEGRDVGLQFVALVGLRAVSRLILAGQVQLLTAGRPVPEIVHLRLVLIHHVIASWNEGP